MATGSTPGKSARGRTPFEGHGGLGFFSGTSQSSQTSSANANPLLRPVTFVRGTHQAFDLSKSEPSEQPVLEEPTHEVHPQPSFHKDFVSEEPSEEQPVAPAPMENPEQPKTEPETSIPNDSLFVVDTHGANTSTQQKPPPDDSDEEEDCIVYVPPTQPSKSVLLPSPRTAKPTAAQEMHLETSSQPDPKLLKATSHPRVITDDVVVPSPAQMLAQATALEAARQPSTSSSQQTARQKLSSNEKRRLKREGRKRRQSGSQFPAGITSQKQQQQKEVPSDLPSDQDEDTVLRDYLTNTRIRDPEESGEMDQDSELDHEHMSSFLSGMDQYSHLTIEDLDDAEQEAEDDAYLMGLELQQGAWDAAMTLSEGEASSSDSSTAGQGSESSEEEDSDDEPDSPDGVNEKLLDDLDGLLDDVGDFIDDDYILSNTSRNKGKKNKGKGRQLDLDSDEEFFAELQAAWAADRERKSARKRARMEARMAHQPTKKTMKAARRAGFEAPSFHEHRGFSAHSVHAQIRDFALSGPGAVSDLALPPLDKKDRVTVHLLAEVYGLKSQSRGSGTRRFPSLSRTSRTSGYLTAQQTSKVEHILAVSAGRETARGQGNGKTKGLWKALQGIDTKQPGKGSVTGGTKSQSIRNKEGEVVGGSAAQIQQDNIGYKLLARMGWNHGDSMGATGSGISVPVAATIKTSKKGLGH